MKMRKLIGFALVIGLIMTAVVCAGCITSSEPDPIVGTFVSQINTNQQSTSINISIDTDEEEKAYMAREYPVGTISHNEVILKFYENGTLLECGIADERVIHSYYTWHPLGNLTYSAINEKYSYEYLLNSNYNEVTVIKLNGYDCSSEFFRNDSYVIPPHYDTHIPNYDKIYNNSDGGEL